MTVVQFPARVMRVFFSSSPRPYRLWAHPASYQRGTGDLFPGVKQPGREVDDSFPPSSEVKNVWSYTSILPYVFMVWCLIKHRDNFTFPKDLWSMLVQMRMSNADSDMSAHAVPVLALSGYTCSFKRRWRIFYTVVRASTANGFLRAAVKCLTNSVNFVAVYVRSTLALVT